MSNTLGAPCLTSGVRRPDLMKICAYCGRENDDAAVQCRECGTDEFKSDAPVDTPSLPPTAVPTKLEFVPLAPEERENDFVTLTRCRTLLEADMIVAQLESAGISAFIPDQFLMQSISWNVNTYGSVGGFGRKPGSYPAGNGAGTLPFHIEHLRRAVPDLWR